MTYANQINHMLGDRERDLIEKALMLLLQDTKDKLANCDRVIEITVYARDLLDLDETYRRIKERKAKAWKDKDKLGGNA